MIRCSCGEVDFKSEIKDNYPHKNKICEEKFINNYVLNNATWRMSTYLKDIEIQSLKDEAMLIIDLKRLKRPYPSHLFKSFIKN